MNGSPDLLEDSVAEEQHRRRSLRGLITPGRIALVVVVVIVVGGWMIFRSATQTSISAYFTNSTGLYVGDDVRVLGVKVGKVTSIEPKGTRVLVKMTVDSDEPIPADAKAAIVAPTLVSGRFVQFSPAWTSGPQLHDGAVLGTDRTTIPVSFDEVKQELSDLSEALGPGADGKQGSLAQAISTLDANLKAGDGSQLRHSIASLRSAANTLSDGRSDLFTTVHNLDSFTRNLAVSDGAVKGFTKELANVGKVLDDNRNSMTAAVSSLGGALKETRTFLVHNRKAIRKSVNGANTLTATLDSRANELAGVLHVAPTALSNLYNIIENQALTARASLTGLDSVAQLVCGALLGVGGTAQQCQTALQPLLETLGLDSVPLGGSTKPSSGSSTTSQPSASSSSSASSNPLSGVTDTLNGLLNGLLGGHR
jgi:phospholipid/cholesterol/gamma-HCH transport system substrate-binding protein